MFSSRKPALLLCAGMIAAGGTLARAAEPGFYDYGDQPTPAQITGWDIDVRGDDGVGLPPGKGTVPEGLRGLRRAMRRLPWYLRRR